MPVIPAPPVSRKLSGFMFSASIVGALARAGVAGVEPAAPGPERFEGEAPLMVVG